MGERSLIQLATPGDLAGVFSRLKTLKEQKVLPRQEGLAIEEVFSKGGEANWTLLHFVLRHDANLELVSLLLDVSALDFRKRDLCSTVGQDGRLPLHCCARNSTRVEVLSLLVGLYPPALTAKDCYGETPLASCRTFNTSRDNYDAVEKILQENTVGPLRDPVKELAEYSAGL